MKIFLKTYTNNTFLGFFANPINFILSLIRKRVDSDDWFWMGRGKMSKAAIKKNERVYISKLRKYKLKMF